jgi:hypothetical protein
MILNAIFLTSEMRSKWADYCAKENWISFSDSFYRTYCGEYQIDTTLKTMEECKDGYTHPYQIMKEKEFSVFIDVLENKTVARFNQGKVDFTLVDFSLFDDYMCSDYKYSMNHIDADATGQSLMSDLIVYVSRLVFIPEKQHNTISRIQMIAYQATAKILGIELDENDNTLDIRVFESMAQVLMYGAKKYERDNWRKLQSDPFASAASLYRHIRDMRNGETLDKESQVHHLGHIMCNVMFLTYAFKR